MASAGTCGRGTVGFAAMVVLLVSTLAAGCGSGESGESGGSGGSGDATVEGSPSPTEGPTSTTEAVTLGAVVIAHRGASMYAPEHTFAAYDLAREQGADYLELDLQLTADGVPVVLHDESLDRTARGPVESCTGTVRTRTLAQIRSCDVGSWFNEAHPDLADPSYAGLTVPTLAEVFDRYGSDVRYYIEIKAPDAQPGLEAALLAVLDQAGLGADDGAGAADRPVIVQSFSEQSLRRLHEQRPELPLVQLFPAVAAPVDPSVLDGVAEYAVGIGPSSESVDAELVEAAHARCLDVHPYTVDEASEMARLLDLGADGLFTDAPDRLVEVRGRQAPPQHCTR